MIFTQITNNNISVCPLPGNIIPNHNTVLSRDMKIVKLGQKLKCLRRVENIILHLRSLEFKNQVNDFTEELVSTFNKVPIPHLSFQTTEQSSLTERAKL